MQDLLPDNHLSYLLAGLGALFVHMCYQLSVSVLTHFNSHSLSRKTSERRLFLLNSSYGLGAILMTALLLFCAVSLTGTLAEHRQILLAIAIFVAPLVGIATVLWYYRQGNGTRLWLPRPIADYLLKRSSKTRSSFEAFTLGAATVVGELPFVIAPLLLVAFLVNTLSPSTWAVWSIVYAVLAYLPLVVITAYLGSGHSAAGVQRWREKNKNFLQWTSGIMLILLTFYLTLIQFGVIP